MIMMPSKVESDTTHSHLLLKVCGQERYLHLIGSAVSDIVNDIPVDPNKSVWVELHSRINVPRFDLGLDIYKRDAIIQLAYTTIDKAINEIEQEAAEYEKTIQEMLDAIAALKAGRGPSSPGWGWIHWQEYKTHRNWVSPSSWSTDGLSQLYDEIVNNMQSYRRELKTTYKTQRKWKDVQQAGLEWVHVRVDTHVTTTFTKV